MLRQLTLGGVQVEVLSSLTLVAGEVALATECWRFCFGGSGPVPFNRDLHLSIVLKHLEEGWRLALVAPPLGR